MPNDQWKIITDKNEVVKTFNQMIKKHLNQAQGSTYIIQSMLILLGYDSFTPFGEALLNRTIYLTNLSLSTV